MSSDDDPASDAVFVHPKSADASSGQSSAAALASSKSATQTSDDGPSSTNASAPGSGSSRTKDFWHTNSITSEPSSMNESSQNSNGGSHLPPRPSRWTKARSTSTESSLSLSGITTFGSTYNQDGFPNYPATSEEEHIAMDDAAIAKQLALTDEAVRAINGTASVVQAGSLGMPTHTANTYELPRSMAAFVRRPGADGTGERDLRPGRSFVSSGSSTSSEESEHLASVQWVTTAVNTSTPQYSYSPYPRPISDHPPRSSPHMPPPASSRPISPRRHNHNHSSGSNKTTTSNNGTPIAVSSSGNGHTPTTQGGFSVPRPPTATTSQQPSASADASPSENNNGGEDDDQTVGGMREGSPSSSSASGLDLLSHAAAHHERSRYSTSVRRKAGAEAVAQWRESGIPSGSPRTGENATPGYDSHGYESTPSAEGNTTEDRSEPPKKRRKSNMMDAPDASLRKPPSESGEHGDGSEYGSDASASDSEYHGKGRKRSSGGKGKKARIRATLLIPPAAQTPAKPSPSTPKKSGGKASTPTSSKSATARRNSDVDAQLKNGGVQCDYVNPLPPYQRCPDVFTRKYDIPRHMARHARREGDLVAEGKLPEEKALLWKTIRDKPRIRCKTCGEYFTRQDALKRHQAKQHH